MKVIIHRYEPLLFFCVHVYACVYKEKGAFGWETVIALVLKLCVDIIVCFSCFLLLTLSTSMHSLIKDGALLLRAERFIKLAVSLV